MRFLFDENLSESIAARLAQHFRGSEHVRRALQAGASDSVVWDFAKRHDFVLVTCDEDFQGMSIALGAPPKVIWLDVHNATNREIAALIVRKADVIERFIADDEAALLVLRQIRTS